MEATICQKGGKVNSLAGYNMNNGYLLQIQEKGCYIIMMQERLI